MCLCLCVCMCMPVFCVVCIFVQTRLWLLWLVALNNDKKTKARHFQRKQIVQPFHDDDYDDDDASYSFRLMILLNHSGFYFKVITLT